MTDTTAVDAATKRLQQALDALESALERRLELDRGRGALSDQVVSFGADRSRLAAELDQAAARASRLETTNREVAQRLDAAIATIRSVLATDEHR
jgi:chromosome segregation ATPase